MGKEIERKYLVKGDEWRASATSSADFLQAYITLATDRSVRVRIIDNQKAKLTVKIGGEFLSRDEFEYEIPLQDAQEMAAQAVGLVLEKTRHLVPFGGHTWEVDVYGGAYAGLVVAEVELDDEHTMPDLPSWIEREITGDRRYSNAVMATENLSGELVGGVSSEGK
jgi:CYTH domain-containing protein